MLRRPALTLAYVQKILLLAFPAFLLAEIALLPFLGKAFNVDDPKALWEAKHILVDPWHPMAFDTVWDLGVPHATASMLAAGPTIGYLMLPSVLSGGKEWCAHLIQLLMLLCGAGATLSLALRMGFSERATRTAGLLLVTSMPVLAMATTAMPDIPAMCFAALAMDQIYAWKKENRFVHALTAGVLIALTVLTRSQLLFLFASGAVFVMDWPAGSFWRLKDRTHIRRLMPLFVAAVTFLLLSGLAKDERLTSAVVGAAGNLLFELGWTGITYNVAAFGIHWVIAFPLALCWFVVRWRSGFLTRLTLVLSCVFTFVLYFFSHPQWLWAGAAAGVGYAVIADICKESVERKDFNQLALAIWLICPLAIVPYSHLPPKYLVGSAPAMALILTRHMEHLAVPVRNVCLAVVALSGLISGVAVSYADGVLADFQREVVNDFIKPLVAKGNQVWFEGHWGFQWYAQEAGAHPVTFTPPLPKRGDLLVVSNSAGPKLKVLHSIRRQMLFQVKPRHQGGVRLLSERGGADFYSSRAGFLPWTWSSDPIGTIEIWEIR